MYDAFDTFLASLVTLLDEGRRQRLPLWEHACVCVRLGARLPAAVRAHEPVELATLRTGTRRRERHGVGLAWLGQDWPWNAKRRLVVLVLVAALDQQAHPLLVRDKYRRVCSGGEGRAVSNWYGALTLFCDDHHQLPPHVADRPARLGGFGARSRGRAVLFEALVHRDPVPEEDVERLPERLVPPARVPRRERRQRVHIELRPRLRPQRDWECPCRLPVRPARRRREGQHRPGDLLARQERQRQRRRARPERGDHPVVFVEYHPVIWDARR